MLRAAFGRSRARRAEEVRVQASFEELIATVKAEDPTAGPNEVTKALSEKWNATADKSKYETAAHEDLERCASAAGQGWPMVGPRGRLHHLARRYQRECAAAGLDPDEAKRKQRASKKDGEEGDTPKKRKKSSKGDGSGDGDGDGDGEEPELLPYAMPAGFTVSERPSAAALVPGSAEGKALVGRSLLYHWDSVGWCLGVVTKSNADKRKTVECADQWPLQADLPLTRRRARCAAATW